jgi:hypothetical protein
MKQYAFKCYRNRHDLISEWHNHIVSYKDVVDVLIFWARLSGFFRQCHMTFQIKTYKKENIYKMTAYDTVNTVVLLRSLVVSIVDSMINVAQRTWPLCNR